MKNAADIENHDKRVRQKWENIIKADKLDGPLLQTIDNIIGMSLLPGNIIGMSLLPGRGFCLSLTVSTY